MINTEYTRIFVYVINPSCTRIPPSRTLLLLVKTSISRNPRQNCSVGGYSLSCIRVQEVGKVHISRPEKSGGVQKERTPIVSQLEFLFGRSAEVRTLGLVVPKSPIFWTFKNFSGQIETTVSLCTQGKRDLWSEFRFFQFGVLKF